MVDKSSYYFTFISTGIVEEDKHLDTVKAELKKFLPGSAGLIDGITPMSELIIEENLDFEDIAELVKVFRNCGAGFRIDLSSQ